jgi:trimethylamine:corrinoid methyltransferase-like protein
MLSAKQMEVLRDRVLQLLEQVGMLVENDTVVEMCLKRGFTHGPDHRLRLPRELIAEMVAFQKKSQKQEAREQELVNFCGPDWAHHLAWTGEGEKFRKTLKRKFLMQAFDCGPTTFYDYRTGGPRPVNTEVFDEMMKFAEATPEIGYTSMWYRQDMPPQIERLASLRRSMDLTSKFAGIEAIYPEVVKYLKAASEILTGDPKSSAYLAGSECMTMPLILEKRSAEDVLERKKHGVHRYHVASMPTMGVSTPATLAGSTVMGAAEILGGMAVCWCVDPESDLTGRMITLIADMRNGNSTTFGPYYTQYDMSVKQLFDAFWGGHCMVEVFFSPSSRRPGLQAVFENYYGTTSRRRWDRDADIPYAGMGTLFNGGLGSPTQFMLDMEIRKAEWRYGQGMEVNDETLDWDEIVSLTRERGNFLSSEHTMKHCRELWNCDAFRSDDPRGSQGWDGSEKAILDRCDEAWRANLAKWEPPKFPADKIRAMDELVARAKKDFGIS